MVREGGLRADSWRESLESAWGEEVAREVSLLPARDDGLPETPERWPDYQVKRARMRRMARRVRDLLLALPEGPGFLPEEELEGYGRLLRGVADLVIRTPESHRVIDYKTGDILDRQTALPRESYVRQLHIYAALEAQTTGDWPQLLHLFPLRGEPMGIEADVAASESVAAEALQLLEDFNAASPGPQPASPSEVTCQHCPFSAKCPAFWSACENWGEELVAVRGQVTRTSSSEFNGTSIEVEVTSGTISESTVLVRNLDPLDHPAVLALVPGGNVGLTGMTREKGRDSYHLPPWGQVATETD
jgi:hypothetical protein